MALADPDGAAGEAAAAVPVLERPANRRRDRPGAGCDLDDPAVRSVLHDDPARVARQTPGRFRGNARAVFEEGLARRLGVGQHRRVDVDDHLVPLAGGAGIEAMVEGRLGEQGQGVGLLLGQGVSAGTSTMDVSAETSSRRRC
jgi:hypothetical protein